jgi:hypothetical protein
MPPSVKTIAAIRPDGKPLEPAAVAAVRAAMVAVERLDYFDRKPSHVRQALETIDTAIGGYGVEYIPAGRGSRSPAIYYVNLGDTYDTTALYVKTNRGAGGCFRVGSWGDIVERGSYE